MTSLNTIPTRAQYSQDKIQELTQFLGENLGHDNKSFTVVTEGSYARGEASEESDLDYLIIHEVEPFDEATKERIDSALKEKVPNGPGNTGTFGARVSMADMLNNIGGNGDSNEMLTRRILFLLESRALWNPVLMGKFRIQLLEKYIKGSIRDHQLPKFLLSDTIRYYRTICTDFEYKIHEEGKEWGLRNIKLMFSRKLLYFSGIVAIADSCHRGRNEKIHRLDSLFNETPIDRITKICGKEASQKALGMYDQFLYEISLAETREYLKSITPDKRDETRFRKLKNSGHRFSLELTNLLRNSFDSNHPIHHSLIM